MVTFIFLLKKIKLNFGEKPRAKIPTDRSIFLTD